MKEFKLRYGKGQINVTLPDNTRIIQPVKKFTNLDESKLISDALDNPINSPRLENFVRPGDKVLIVIPDRTRKARVDFILKFILERISSKNLKIIFANGTHSKQSEEDKIKIIGAEYYRRFSDKIFENDAFSENNKVYIGRTSRGTNVIINKIVVDADKIIAIGSITHHYFAGFGGGAKMFIPGLAAYQTALENHQLTLTPDGNLNPNAGNLKLDGNPVYEDIIEAFKLCNLKAVFIGVVLDEDDRIVNAVYGDVVSSHRTGAEFVRENFTIPIREKFELLISSAGGFPKDINFIQSHKSIHHSYYAVKDGGVLITLVECHDGIGSKTFLRWFKYKTDDEMRIELMRNYSMNGHTALSLRNKLKNVKIISVTKLEQEIVRRIGLTYAEDIQKAIEICGGVNKFKLIGIFPNASIYIPIYQE